MSFCCEIQTVFRGKCRQKWWIRYLCRSKLTTSLGQITSAQISIPRSSWRLHCLQWSHVGPQYGTCLSTFWRRQLWKVVFRILAKLCTPAKTRSTVRKLSRVSTRKLITVFTKKKQPLVCLYLLSQAFSFSSASPLGFRDNFIGRRTHATCPNHLVFLSLMAVIISGEGYLLLSTLHRITVSVRILLPLSYV